MQFQYSFTARWSDLDPNMHMRHSAYYDYGAQARINALSDIGCTMMYLKQINCLPILFREEAFFKKEIRENEKFSVSLELVSSSVNF